MKLKAYFVQEKGAPWSVLSFNYNRQDAKVMAYNEWPATECEYIDLRVKRADEDYKIFCEKDEPHVIDSWGTELQFDHDEPSWNEALQQKLMEQYHGML